MATWKMAPACYVRVLVYFATAERRGRYTQVFDNWRSADAYMRGLRHRAAQGDCQVWAYARGGGIASFFRTFSDAKTAMY